MKYLRLLLTSTIAIVGSLVVAATLAQSLNITGQNTEYRNSIFQVGVLRISRDEAVTATPSGTITTSYALSAGLTQVTTVATAADSVKLPLTTGQQGGGLVYIVVNATANAMNVFPAQAADTINALSGGTAFSVAAGKTVMFVVASDGKWYGILSA